MPGSASGISEEIWTYVRTGTSKHTYILSIYSSDKRGSLRV
jgi:hypothetical protein